MATEYSPGERVTLQWLGEELGGSIWSHGPSNDSYWVIPDHAVPDMVQGCVHAGAVHLRPMTEATLF